MADSEISGSSDDKNPPGRERTGGHGEHGGRRSSRPRGNGRLTAAKAAQMGLEQIAEVTGKAADSVASVEPSDDSWIVGVEVVEDRRIPSSTDILAIYQAELDHSGELLSYRRVKRYKRGQGGGDYEGESW